MSLEEYALALFRPDRVFDGWRPDGRVVAGVVLLCCVAAATSFAVSGGDVTAAVDGTVTVDNPYDPSESVCKGDAAEYWNCDAPPTVERSLSAAAADAVGGLALQAALVPVAWVLLVATLLVVAAGRIGGRDAETMTALADATGITAFAALPGLLRAAARPVAVELGLVDWTYPASLDGVGPAAVHALFPDGQLWSVVVVISGLWTAAIVYGGARGAFDVKRRRAGAVAVVAGLSVAASAFLAHGGWFGTPTALGVVFVVGGAVGLAASRTLLTISKTLELIGYSGSRGVEPKPWYVALHRLGAAVALAVGFVLLDGLALV